MGGLTDTHKPRPTIMMGFDVPKSTTVGSVKIATKTGVGKSKGGLAIVRNEPCLLQVQPSSSFSSWPGPHGEATGSLMSQDIAP